MNEIPFLRIVNWGPGATPETNVSVEDMKTGRRILTDVPLRTARLIVACVNHCAEEHGKLANIADRIALKDG